MKHPKDKGSIYITVMIILAVLLMLLTMLMIITTKDIRTTHLYSQGIRAYYLAHSGLAQGLAYAKSNPEENQTEVIENPFPAQYPAYHRLEWQVEYNKDEDNYIITATGYYHYNKKITIQRRLEAIVRIEDDLVEILSWRQKYKE
ncbi:MAG TPA: hypothetical protein GXX46_01070 [Peptococcaceae bacterium]|nr:hypothetical protein [Peptococcaceae bacterium]